MARFSEHTLRPEEELGGFEFEAGQDETFLLERLPKYPGKLDSYLPDNDVDEDEAEIQPVRTDEQPVPDGVSEAFKNEPAARADEIKATQEVPVEFEDVSLPGSAVAFDEDFLQSLRSEVAEAEERKSQQDVSEYINFQAPNGQKKEFSIDESDGAHVFDLSDIDAQHPSSYGLKAEESTAEPVAENIAPPIIVEENQTMVQEEREKSSALPWLAAALVLLALAGAGGWWFLKDNFQPKPQIALKKDSLHVTTENGVAPEIIKDTAKNGIAVNDSLKNTVVKSDSLKSVAQVVATDNKTIAKAPEVLKETAKINPDTSPVSLTVKPKVIAQRTVREVRPKEPVLKRSENGLYMVQVYSSPSREDAEDWLARLRERNAGNAVVTTQKIRGQEWYRVRFGSYPTRTEAENAALKLGFAQSWIVQIR